MVTDSKRLQQVLKNLLSNAFKFTAEGGVRLTVSAALGGWSAEHPILNHAPAVVAFEVTDTGIGIPLEKQKLIFEAFQQADAGTSRKYGGTGLGLAISRELASLLGGEIHLRSAPGKGSTFMLYLPLKYSGPDGRAAHPCPVALYARRRRCRSPRRRSGSIEQLPDDRLNLEPGDTILLIVEDDPHYARVLIDLARDKGFKVLVANRGAEALELAKQFQPTAVSLDVFLPDMLGWTVLSQLKHNPLTRHIPVQIITLDEDRQHALARGAFSFVNKPTTTEGVSAALSQIKEYAKPRRKRLLIVEDNAAEQMSIKELLDHDDIEIVTAGHRRRRAVDAARQSVRLRRAGSAAARHERLRGARPDPQRRNAVERSGRRVHGAGTFGRGRCGTSHHGAKHRGQGRGVAGTPARRNVAVFAPCDHGIAGRKAEDAREAQ